MMVKSGKKKVLLVCYGGGHVNMIVPLAKTLLSEKQFEVLVLGLTTAGRVLEKNGIPYIGFKDLLDSENQDEALLYGKQLYGQLDQSQTLVDEDESIAYLGLSFLELVNIHGQEKANELMRFHGRQSFLPVCVMEKLISTKEIDLVLATNAPRAVRASLIAASNLGVKSICIVDSFGRRSMFWVSNHDFSDKVCVISEFVKKEFVENGRPKNDLIVTGNPAFDSFQKIIVSDREIYNFRSSVGWNDSKAIILWASQIEPGFHPNDINIKGNCNLPREIEEQLLNIAEKLDIYLIFRRHPNELVNDTSLLNERVYLSTSKDDLPLLIRASKCVVTMTSTVGFGALMMGKALITVNRSVFTKDVAFGEYDLSIGVESYTELEMAIKRSIANKRITLTANAPTSATKKVISVVKELLSN